MEHEHECSTTLVRCDHCGGLKPLLHRIWILEIPDERLFAFKSLAALKAWVADSEDCPVTDYFGNPVEWLQRDGSDVLVGRYYEHTHTAYIYARPMEVTA